VAMFIFPFLFFLTFFRATYLVVFLFPAFSIIYLIISNNKEKKQHNKKSFIPENKKKVFGLPLVIFGFIFFPLLFSIIISIIDRLDFYTIVVFISIVSLFITTGFYIPLSVYERYFAKKNKLLNFSPPVTIIVPAYNEETGIARTIDSILEADYPYKEVIVVDDGSIDQTYHIASSYKNKFKNGSSYAVIHKLNGGKASAINHALRFSKNEIVIIIDADSIINKIAIKSIVKHFYDENVIAVGGYIRVYNFSNILTNCTALEVLNAWNLIGRAFSFLGTVMIVPGALGAFRKKVIVERGFYEKDTLTEDFDLTIKILKTKGKIAFEGSSLSYTDIPNNIKDLYRQRRRWYIGNFQTIIKHFNIFTNPSYNLLFEFGYPIVLFLTFGRAIWSFLIPISIVLAILSGRYIPLAISLLMFISYSFILSAIAFIMDGQRERSRLILYSPLMIIGYAQILDIILIKGLLDILFRKKAKWTRAKRTTQ